MGTRTPWGVSDHKDVVVRGLIFYGTPSHGGYHLSSKMEAKVPAALRAICQHPGWYEEDCEYVVVHLAFPDLFPNAKQDDLKSCLKQYNPWAYEAHYGEEVKPEESWMKRELLKGDEYAKVSYERWARRYSAEAAGGSHDTGST